jgi:putative transposase
MPTKKRISVPGAIAHIMARGIDGVSIFKDPSDQQYFVDLLSNTIKKNDYRCYGWVLMDNHFHLIVRCSDRPLNDLMRGTNSKYARYFNKKYQRHGYLFQDRFKSIISQDQHYLEELLRYVHLNPLRAGVCKSIGELDSFPWCGHSVLMGYQKHPFQSTKEVLRYFGSNEKLARMQYRKFIEAGIKSVSETWIDEAIKESNREICRKDRPHCLVIGDHEYVQSVMKSNEQRLRSWNELRQKWSIEKVFDRIAEENKLPIGDFKKKSRESISSKCKKIGAFICCRTLGYSGEEVAAYLKMTSPAVSWSIKTIEGLLSKDEINKFINLTPG